MPPSALQNLTEFNTAHNKRVTNVGYEEATAKPERTQKRKSTGNVSFSEDDKVITPGWYLSDVTGSLSGCAQYNASPFSF